MTKNLKDTLKRAALVALMAVSIAAAKPTAAAAAAFDAAGSGVAITALAH